MPRIAAEIAKAGGDGAARLAQRQQAGYNICLFEKFFTIKTVDYLGNAIDGVSVEIINPSGYGCIYRRTGAYLDVAMTTKNDTSISLSSNSGLSINDYIMLAGEVMQVTSVDNIGGKLIGVSMGLENTIRQALLAGVYIYKREIPTTSSGAISMTQHVDGSLAPVIFEQRSYVAGGTLESLVYSYVDVKLTKTGYETETIKNFPVAHAQRADIAGKTITVKMRHSPTPGRDEMGLSMS